VNTVAVETLEEHVMALLETAHFPLLEVKVNPEPIKSEKDMRN
jgi:hypothetical protein